MEDTMKKSNHPELLLLSANVESTLAENEASLIKPKEMTVTVTPDVSKVVDTRVVADTGNKKYKKTPVVSPRIIESDIAYRIGGLPNFKDKVKAISTARMRIEYAYLEDRLQSNSTYMLLEGINALIKIASDLRYHRSAVNELIRGVDDARSIIRIACIEGLAQVGSLSTLAIIEKRIKLVTGLNAEKEAELNSALDRTREQIKKYGPMRSCMLRVYEGSLLEKEPNVPPMYGFYGE